jgi:hypothetical protein
MGQALFTLQGFLWRDEERCQGSNLDRYLRLCAGRNRQKHLNLDQGLFAILQILYVTLSEKTPIFRAFSDIEYTRSNNVMSSQLSLLS